MAMTPGKRIFNNFYGTDHQSPDAAIKLAHEARVGGTLKLSRDEQAFIAAWVRSDGRQQVNVGRSKSLHQENGNSLLLAHIDGGIGLLGEYRQGVLHINSKTHNDGHRAYLHEVEKLAITYNQNYKFEYLDTIEIENSTPQGPSKSQEIMTNFLASQR